MTLGITLLVFTFIMCIGTLIKAIDYLSMGMEGWFILKFFLASIPYILSFTIPMSSLISVLLLFSRLSMDGEVTAMKASGMTMWQIAYMPLVCSVVLSIFCMYLNMFAAPNSHFANRKMLFELGIETPLALIEPGRQIRDFPGVIFEVDERDGMQLKGVSAYQLKKDSNNELDQLIHAESGEIIVDEENHLIHVILNDVVVERPDPDRPNSPSAAMHMAMRKYPVKLDFSELLGKSEIRKRTSDLTFPELVFKIRHLDELLPTVAGEDEAVRASKLEREKMGMIVKANERLALSLSCFAFTMLGISLGMRSKRRESSIGIGIALLVVFGFYIFILLAKSLADYPRLVPDLIIWVPVFICEIAGLHMIRRMN